jgi:hypothetical protein
MLSDRGFVLLTYYYPVVLAIERARAADELVMAWVKRESESIFFGRDLVCILASGYLPASGRVDKYLLGDILIACAISLHALS